MLYLRLFAFLFSLSFFFACGEDPSLADPEDSKSLDRILVPNYGVWGTQSGSLTEYRFASDSITRDVYYAANKKFLPKGVQSVVLWENKLFVTCVDDNLIVILDSKTYIETARIFTGTGTGPNYLTNGSDGNLYFSQTNGTIRKFNPVTFEITDLEGSLSYPSELVSLNGKLYVTGTNNYLAVFSQATNKLEKTIKMGVNPLTLAVNGSVLAVLCAGNYTDVFGGIYLVDTSTDLVSDSLKFENSFPFSQIAFSSGGTLFYDDGGLKSVPVAHGKFGSVNCFSTLSGHPFYVDGHPSALFVITGSKDSQLHWLNNGTIVKSYPLGVYANGTALAIYQ